jgi:hypothetical protein
MNDFTASIDNQRGEFPFPGMKNDGVEAKRCRVKVIRGT